MDLTERIDRRRTRNSKNELVVDPDSLNPVAHPTEPVGRETLFEALLDAIDPLFEQVVPPNVYVWGPSGSGKSAIVTALTSALNTKMRGQQPFYASTRGGGGSTDVECVYLDARQATSQFQLYRELLDSLRMDPVPERGISTETLEDEINAITARREVLLVAVDHLGEPRTVSVADIHEFFEPFEKLSWIGIGRKQPEEVPLPLPARQIRIPEYAHELVDVLTVRGSRGLSHTLDHTHARTLSEWADGDAHDALGALFVAANRAADDGATRLRDADVEAAIDVIPKDGVPMGQVLALSDNEQLVLEHLLELCPDDGARIETQAEEIAAETELTASTVKRLLYELAQFDILERRAITVGASGNGRRPSGVVPNFSADLFATLRRE